MRARGGTGTIAEGESIFEVSQGGVDPAAGDRKQPQQTVALPVLS